MGSIRPLAGNIIAVHTNYFSSSGKVVELFVAKFDAKPLAALMVFGGAAWPWYVYGASKRTKSGAVFANLFFNGDACAGGQAQGLRRNTIFWVVPDEDDKRWKQIEAAQEWVWGVLSVFKARFLGGELKTRYTGIGSESTSLAL